MKSTTIGVVAVLVWSLFVWNLCGQQPRAAVREEDDHNADLGKRLFFDPSLSANGRVSCASCHDPTKGFSSGAYVIGLDGKRLLRRPPALLNCGASKRLFWDGRAKSLEEQALGPLLNPAEMGNRNVPDILERLQPKYGKLTEAQLTGALADFERTLRSPKTRFDRYLRGENTLTASEVRGWNLFRGKAECYQCHTDKSPFTDNDFHNTGIGGPFVEGDPRPFDNGRYMVTGAKADVGKFKTPQLRGVRHSAPYFHDGSVPRLEDVVEYYSTGFFRNKFLDKKMKPLNLTQREGEDLVAFLRAL